MFEIVGCVVGGFVGGEGVVDLFGSMLFYCEGGVEVFLFVFVCVVGEYFGDVFMIVVGVGGGVFGYIVGGFGDFFVSFGVMDCNQVNCFVCDVMVMLEVFVGLFGQVMIVFCMVVLCVVWMVEEVVLVVCCVEGVVLFLCVLEVLEVIFVVVVVLEMVVFVFLCVEVL